MFPSFNDKSKIPVSLAKKVEELLRAWKIYGENVGDTKVSVVRVKFKGKYTVLYKQCAVYNVHVCEQTTLPEGPTLTAN